MTTMHQDSIKRRMLAAGLFVAGFFPAAALAQGVAAGQPGRIQLPTVTVTAQKEPADPQTLPVSVTAVSRETLSTADVRVLREASIYAPNTYFSDFTARKLSNPRFRGIGSSPANPAITTNFDGVPQLNSNTSSIELLDVEQVEFIRGPQSALFGRNTLAGVVNVSSVRPSLTDWTYGASVPLSNFGARDVRASISGPLAAGRVGVSGCHRLRASRRVHAKRGDGQRRGRSLGVRRQGTGAVDAVERLGNARDREWRTRARWRLRAQRSLGAAGESLRGGTRFRRPHGSRSDGHDAARRGELAARINAVDDDRVRELEDRRRDRSRLHAVAAHQAQQHENRASSSRRRCASGPPRTRPWRVSPDVPVRWQAGVFLFTQNYEQDADQHVLAVRALAVGAAGREPALSAVDARRRGDMACTGRRPRPSTTGWMCRSVRASITRTRRPRSTRSSRRRLRPDVW